jgi:hypothetical protein
MTTKLQADSIKAVESWCKQQGLELEKKPRHVHPRAYVVGYAAQCCLVVSTCWAESEPQVREKDRKYPLTLVRTFDHSLKAGDWCITAYVSYPGVGEPVAVPLPEAPL